MEEILGTNSHEKTKNRTVCKDLKKSIKKPQIKRSKKIIETNKKAMQELLEQEFYDNLSSDSDSDLSQNLDKLKCLF